MNATHSSLRTVGILGAAGALVLVGTPAMADNHTATVSVLHAVPDTPVDVYANGERLIDDFQPGTLTDPLTLPAGSYDLAVFPADAADDSGDPILVGRRRRGARRRQRHRGGPPDGRGPAQADAVRQRHLGHPGRSGPRHRPAPSRPPPSTSAPAARWSRPG